MNPSTTHDVATTDGPGRLHVAEASAVRGVLMLGGGASGQIATVDLDALAAALPGRGWVVARYELPFRVAGAKIGPRPPRSDPAWLAGVDAVRAAWPGVPLVTGGRSAGARIACRTWTPALAGVVALSFPLHPPGKPGMSRAAEAQGVGVRMCLVSGARDPFGTPEELAAELVDAPSAGPRRLAIVPGATHSFPTRVADLLVGHVAAFLDDIVPV